MKKLKLYTLATSATFAICNMSLAQQLPKQPETPIAILQSSVKSTVSTVPKVQFAEYREVAAPSPNQALPIPVPPIEELYLDREALKFYTSRVQPVLANTCASCHARKDHESAFKLRAITEGYANPQATDVNMHTTAKFVNRTSVASSPLLLYAMKGHGGRKESPIFSREHPAFKYLEIWARGISVDEQASTQGIAKATPKLPNNPNSVHLAGVGLATTPPQMNIPKVTEFGQAQPPQPNPTYLKLNPDDPFDPAKFNLANPTKK